MTVHVVRCAECGRRFDDVEAHDAHIDALRRAGTPHKRDIVQVIMTHAAFYPPGPSASGVPRSGDA